MVKKLPQVKKGLKEFILDEDAKVIDKTATKISIMATFLAINFLGNTDDANAKGHSNHSNHQNILNAPENAGTGIHGGTNPVEVGVNQIPAKSVETMHANHYNHQDQSGGGQSGMGMLIGAVVAVAAAAAGPGGAGLALAAVNWGATALVAAGGALVGGAVMSGMGGDDSGGDIDAGSPHQVPESILRALEEEEES